MSTNSLEIRESREMSDSIDTSSPTEMKGGVPPGVLGRVVKVHSRIYEIFIRNILLLKLRNLGYMNIYFLDSFFYIPTSQVLIPLSKVISK